MVAQMSLFVLPSTVPEVQLFDPLDDDIVLVYSCARSGRTSTGRFFMRRDEAMRFCSTPQTAGRGNYGSEWLMMWTSLTNLRAVLGEKAQVRVVDDGRFADLLAQLDITPVPASDPRVSWAVA